MHFGTHDQLVLLGLLAVMAALLTAAPAARIPFPVFLVLGGLALGFVPGMPTIQLPPDVVLVAVLPPLLYISAYNTSLRDLRQNIRPIGLLAIVLVVATTCAVAAVAHSAIDGFSWSSAFVLGAVVSPTDALAATKIAHRLGVPRRLVAIIEGGSLGNDGAALVLYKVAVTAVVAGTFSMWNAGLHFVWCVLGGIGIGLVIGYLIAAVRRRLANRPLEITIAIMTGYFAFIPASAAGASGVLAVVTAGVYMGWHTPELTSVQTRLQGDGVWQIITFVLNALLFALVGLQLSHILDTLTGTSSAKLIEYALLVTGSVREDTAERLRGLYGFRRDRFASRFDDGADGSVEEQSQSYQRVRRELLEAERSAIVGLRRDGIINDDVMRGLERDLDLEDARLDV